MVEVVKGGSVEVEVGREGEVGVVVGAVRTKCKWCSSGIEVKEGENERKARMRHYWENHREMMKGRKSEVEVEGAKREKFKLALEKVGRGEKIASGEAIPEMEEVGGSYVSEEIVRPKGMKERLVEAFGEIRDVDAKSQIGMMIELPYIDTMTREEVEAECFKRVKDGDARAVLWGKLSWIPR